MTTITNWTAGTCIMCHTPDQMLFDGQCINCRGVPATAPEETVAPTTEPPVDRLAQWEEMVRRSRPRPRTWDDVVGNATAVEILREAVAAARMQNRPVPHLLLFSPPGTGKTTLAQLVAQDIGGCFIATTASTLETPADLMRIVLELNWGYERMAKPSVLFVDEIHMLGACKGRAAIDMESVYPLLEDWIWPHNLLGKEIQGRDGTHHTITSSAQRVWPFTMIGATTEPGILNQALLRRFLLHVEIAPYTEDDIARIIAGAVRLLGWEMEDGTESELAKYARCNPGRAMQLITQARNRALASGRDVITMDVVNKAIARLRLYPLGLTETDIRVLKLLADRMPRGMGATEICRAVGVSASQLGGMIEPYLRQLSFTEVLSRRVIRPEGLRYLHQIGQIDTTRPEVRAAVEAHA